MFFTNPKMENYQIIDSEKKLRNLVAGMMLLQEFAFDTETNTKRVLGKNKSFKLVGISISWGRYNNYYIPLGHARYEDYGRQLDLALVVKWLRKVFGRKDVRVIGQNLKFDMHVLKRVGIDILTDDLFDTMIASWLCDENTPNGLKDNSKAILKAKQTHFKEVTELVPKEVKKEFGLKPNSKATFDLVLIDDGAPYALDDSFYTFLLYPIFLVMLEEEKMEKTYFKTYRPFIRTLFNMEEKGVEVDLKRCDEMSVEMQKDIDELLYQLTEIAGVEINFASNQQLAELIFGYQPTIIPPWEVKVEQSKWAYADEKQRAKLKKDYEKKLEAQENSKILPYSFGFRVLSTTGKGAPQTNADTLWGISKMEFKKNKRKAQGVEFCKLLLDYKKLLKLKSSFVEGLKEQLYDDGKAHPSFNIIGTDSGRLSCSEPNLQQLPKANEDDKYQIRSLFIGSMLNGVRKKIVALDESNLEMRVLGHFSEDKILLNMFSKDLDAHGDTAVNMFELDCDSSEAKKKYPHLRQAAKTINFMLMYGGGAQTLYENLKGDRYNPIDLGDKVYTDLYKKQIERMLDNMKPKQRAKFKSRPGVLVAQIYIDKYFSTYAGVAEFIKNQKRFAHKYGYVYTLLKRKRRLPDINGQDFGKVSYCERLSVNSTIQGSAADITMSAQNRVDSDPWFEEHDVYMIIQIHDELVFECPEEFVEECIEKVKWYMEHPFGDNVKLNLALKADADSGDTYQDAK